MDNQYSRFLLWRVDQMDSSQTVIIQIEQPRRDSVMLHWSATKTIWKVTLETYREKKWKKDFLSLKKSWKHFSKGTENLKNTNKTRTSSSKLTSLTILLKSSVRGAKKKMKIQMVINSRVQMHWRTKWAPSKNNSHPYSNLKKTKELNHSRTKNLWVLD